MKWLRCLVVIAVVTTLCTPLPASAASAFAARVRVNFEKWDLNHDGRLTADELSKLMTDSAIRGDDAAALATLRYYARPAVKPAPFVCTLAALRQIDANPRGFPPLERRYEANRRRIAEAVRDLYAAGAPHRDSIHQVSGGDCYFLSVIGALITRDAASLRALVSREGDTFVVRLPQGAPVIVKDPTDAEIAMYTDNTSDGMWLYAMQRAYILQSLKLKPRDVDKDQPLEMIDRGGSSTIVMHLLLGTPPIRVVFGPNGNAAAQKKLRQALNYAFSHKRLVTINTPPANNPMAMPRGLPKFHVLSVIGWNRDKDEVTIWNPWGNELKPSGNGALAGFETHRGVFTVPLADAVKYFVGVTIEGTSRAAAPSRPAKSAAEERD